MALEWWKIFALYHCEPKTVNVSIGEKDISDICNTQLKSMSAELQNLCFYFYAFVFKITKI